MGPQWAKMLVSRRLQFFLESLGESFSPGLLWFLDVLSLHPLLQTPFPHFQSQEVELGASPVTWLSLLLPLPLAPPRPLSSVLRGLMIILTGHLKKSESFVRYKILSHTYRVSLTT